MKKITKQGAAKFLAPLTVNYLRGARGQRAIQLAGPVPRNVTGRCVCIHLWYFLSLRIQPYTRRESTLGRLHYTLASCGWVA